MSMSSGTVTSTLASSVGRSERLALLDDAFRLREQGPGNLQALERAFEQSLAEAPSDYELLWRMARVNAWIADGTYDDVAKREVAKRAMAFAVRAIDTSAHGLDGHYYYALSLGMYAQAAGVLRAIAESLESKFQYSVNLVIERDEAFEYAGGRMLKGRYYWELPWPKRNLSKAREELERAVSLCPLNLRARLYLAEVLVAQRKIPEALQTLAALAVRDVRYEVAEGERIQARARDLAQALAQSPG